MDDDMGESVDDSCRGDVGSCSDLIINYKFLQYNRVISSLTSNEVF